MLDVVHMWNDEVEAFYSDQIVNQKRIYSQRFVIVVATLIFVIVLTAVTYIATVHQCRQVPPWGIEPPPHQPEQVTLHKNNQKRAQNALAFAK